MRARLDWLPMLSFGLCQAGVIGGEHLYHALICPDLGYHVGMLWLYDSGELLSRLPIVRAPLQSKLLGQHCKPHFPSDS